MNILSKARTQNKGKASTVDQAYFLGKVDDGNELFLGRNVLRYL